MSSPPKRRGLRDCLGKRPGFSTGQPQKKQKAAVSPPAPARKPAAPLWGSARRPQLDSQAQKQPAAVKSARSRVVAFEPDLSLPLTERYRPRLSPQIIGNRAAVNQMRQWLIHRVHQTTKALLLSGPPGVGKTTSSHVLLRELSYDVEEVNASETRTGSTLVALLQNLHSFKQPGRPRPPGIVVDEVDGIYDGDDSEYASHTIDCLCSWVSRLQPTDSPVIFICNNPWSRSMRRLAQCCEHVRFWPLRPEELQCVLRTVLHYEKQHSGLTLTPQQQHEVIQAAHGDARALQNFIHVHHVSTDPDAHHIQASIFQSCQKLLCPGQQSLATLERVYQSDELNCLMLHQNYNRACSDISSVDAVASTFSELALLSDDDSTTCLAQMCRSHFQRGRVPQSLEFPQLLTTLKQRRSRAQLLAAVTRQELELSCRPAPRAVLNHSHVFLEGHGYHYHLTPTQPPHPSQPYIHCWIRPARDPDWTTACYLYCLDSDRGEYVDILDDSDDSTPAQSCYLQLSPTVSVYVRLPPTLDSDVYAPSWDTVLATLSHWSSQSELKKEATLKHLAALGIDPAGLALLECAWMKPTGRAGLKDAAQRLPRVRQSLAQSSTAEQQQCKADALRFIEANRSLIQAALQATSSSTTAAPAQPPAGAAAAAPY